MNNKLPWQTAMKEAITDPAELLSLLKLDQRLANAIAAKRFALRVPHSFVARMEKGNPADPLLRQVLPIAEETNSPPDYSSDPLSEKMVNPIPGLLHKYYGRVLLIIAGACGINCRYCFRREFPYHENNPGAAGWEKALDYIRQDHSIHEVILSGGDPLLATDKRLAALTKQLDEIQHVKTLRIHSRMPIVLPERITAEFIDWFTTSRLKPVLVIHCNHPHEINADVAQAIEKLKTQGATLLNQSVLLKGVNDSADTLINLSKKLFAIHVLPYYLHLLDKVSGAAHFDVSPTTAKRLIKQMTVQLPGYLVPKLVCEKAGEAAKKRIS